MTREEAQIKLADAIDMLASAGIKIASVAREYGLTSTLAPLDERIQAVQLDLDTAFQAL